MNAISLMAADPAAGGSMSATLITFVLIILIFYFLIIRPHEIDVFTKSFCDHTGRVCFLRIRINHNLQHHPWVISRAAALFVSVVEWRQVQTVHDCIYDPHQMIFRYKIFQR